MINQTLHKWLSLIVGVQLLIWLGTGLYFNLMDSEKASGNGYRQSVSHHGHLNANKLLPLAALADDIEKPIAAAKLTWVLQKPYWLLHFEHQAHATTSQARRLFNAYTGHEYQLSQAEIVNIAKQSYTGPGEPTDVHFYSASSELIKMENPHFGVSMNDALSTTVYVDAITGRVLAHINEPRRLRDLMFMLHFMDYWQTGSFNHSLIILFALLTLLFASTGMIWVVDLVRSGQLRLPFRGEKQALNVVCGNEHTLIYANSKYSVLENLANAGFRVPSNCGGGGSCGLCKVVTEPNAPISRADMVALTQSELEKGLRLSCQQSVSSCQSVTLLNSDSKRFTLTLESSRFITPIIKELTFSVPHGVALNFKAGAFVRFYIPEGEVAHHPDDLPSAYVKSWQRVPHGSRTHHHVVRHYSIAHAPNQTNTLTFTVRWHQASHSGTPAGIGSSYLGQLPIGSTIEAEGPFNDFQTRDEEFAPQILIGGGSGLAPLKAMAESLCENPQSNVPCVFLFGARSDDDLMYQSHFENLAKQHSNFSYVPVLSRPTELWQGKVGYVQHILEEVLAQSLVKNDLTEAQFYLCGPSAMMRDVKTHLLKLGVHSEHIHQDTFTY